MQTYLAACSSISSTDSPPMARVSPGRGESRLSEQDIGQYYVPQRAGQHGPLSTLVSTRRITGPNTPIDSTCTRGAGPGLGRVRVQLRAGAGRLEQVAAQVLPREMGYGFADLSYQEKKASGTAGRSLPCPWASCS